MRRAGPALAVVLTLVLFACTGDGHAPRPTGFGPELPRGGTLRVVWLAPPPVIDPAFYSIGIVELARCCLLRTLLATNGRPTDEGGAQLRPDLASGLPEISPDEMTWTFHLKSDIHYAPPFQDREIVASDFVRALNREADVAPERDYYAGFLGVIEGFDDARREKADTISGLETADDHTLVVRLTEPTSDLGYRLAFPFAAPLPPGAADGHGHNYGRYLVSSGPYMFEGSEDLDFSGPAHDQDPVSGYVPPTIKGKEFKGVPPTIVRTGWVTLVRNPAWDAFTDGLRPAYADRIEIDLGAFEGHGVYLQGGYAVASDALKDRAFAQVESGERDLVFDTSTPPADLVRTFDSDPELEQRLHENQTVSTFYVSMNLAAPPFDDVHVRRAVSLVVDKQSMVGYVGTDWQLPGSVSTHLIPDSVEGNLLAGYGPAWASGDADGDLAAAQAEMRRSRYDRDRNGSCDDAACWDVPMVIGEFQPARAAEVVRDDLRRIGIRVRLRIVPQTKVETTQWRAPRLKIPLSMDGWIADWPDGANLFPVLFSMPSAQADLPLLGATSRQLKGWGYRITEVPSVDERIERCLPLRGQARVDCWAGLDQYLMDEVVPWVPFMFGTVRSIVSERVAAYSFDQFIGAPALDRIALAPEGG